MATSEMQSDSTARRRRVSVGARPSRAAPKFGPRRQLAAIDGGRETSLDSVVDGLSYDVFPASITSAVGLPSDGEEPKLVSTEGIRLPACRVVRHDDRFSVAAKGRSDQAGDLPGSPRTLLSLQTGPAPRPDAQKKSAG